MKKPYRLIPFGCSPGTYGSGMSVFGAKASITFPENRCRTSGGITFLIHRSDVRKLRIPVLILLIVVLMSIYGFPSARISATRFFIFSAHCPTDRFSRIYCCPFSAICR